MDKREIKFRVRESRPSKRWAYFKIPHKIIWEGVWDLDTLGQFTGISDFHGADVFEGDIVKTASGDIAEVVFVEGCFSLKMPWGLGGIAGEIIGNIHDNPELL